MVEDIGLWRKTRFGLCFKGLHASIGVQKCLPDLHDLVNSVH